MNTKCRLLKHMHVFSFHVTPQLHAQMSQSFASTLQPGLVRTGARSAPTWDCCSTSWST